MTCRSRFWSCGSARPEPDQFFSRRHSSAMLSSAAQTRQNSADLLLRRKLPSRDAADLLDNMLRRFLHRPGFLSHRRSFNGYDGPESSLPQPAHSVSARCWYCQPGPTAITTWSASTGIASSGNANNRPRLHRSPLQFRPVASSKSCPYSTSFRESYFRVILDIEARAYG